MWNLHVLFALIALILDSRLFVKLEQAEEEILPSQDGYYLDTLNEVAAGTG